MLLLPKTHHLRNPEGKYGIVRFIIITQWIDFSELYIISDITVMFAIVSLKIPSISWITSMEKNVSHYFYIV